MSVIKCPHCEGRFAITAIDAPKEAPDASPITAAALRAVREFLILKGPGRYTVKYLFEEYEFARPATRGPHLTKQAFVLALQRNGATRWRNGQSRGYEIPEITAETPQARVAPSTEVREARKDYEEAVAAHTGAPKARFIDISEFTEMPS